MNRFRIKNTNIYDLKTIFKGEDVLIEPGEFWKDKKGNIREMDIFEAHEFRGAYHPTLVDGSGKLVDDARYFKKVEVIPCQTEEEKASVTESHRCMAPQCKHVSASSEELVTHTQVKHGSMEKTVLPEMDQEIERKKKIQKAS